MVSHEWLQLPYREQKPRKNCITILIDSGVPLCQFEDVIESLDTHIDFVKVWLGDIRCYGELSEKIACLRNYPIDFFFGGTLFEILVSQGKVE